MSWFKVDDGFHSSRKVLSIPKRTRWAAIGVWTVAGAWSANQLTDGFIPTYMLNEWGIPPAAPEALVEAGLWEGAPNGYVFHKWAEYQPRKEDVDAEREASRARMRDIRARRKQGKTPEQAEKEVLFGRTGTNGSESVRQPDPTRPDHSSSKEEEVRPEVAHLCEQLSDLIEENGSLRPKVTQAWLDDCRRMIDIDKREPEKIENLIRWSQRDSFWRKNILSMPKFRKQYDQVRLAAVDEWEKNKSGFNPDGGIDVDAILGPDHWSPGASPDGLSIKEELEWKRQQREQHAADRLEKARRKTNEQR